MAPVQAQGSRLASEGHQVHRKPCQLKHQGPYPLCPFRGLYARKLFYGHGVALLVDVRFGNAYAAYQWEVLYPQLLLHELLEAPVQVAHMCYGLRYLVAVEPHLDAHVPGYTRVLRPEEEVGGLLGVGCPVVGHHSSSPLMRPMGVFHSPTISPIYCLGSVCFLRCLSP